MQQQMSQMRQEVRVILAAMDADQAGWRILEDVARLAISFFQAERTWKSPG